MAIQAASIAGYTPDWFMANVGTFVGSILAPGLAWHKYQALAVKPGIKKTIRNCKDRRVFGVHVL